MMLKKLFCSIVLLGPLLVHAQKDRPLRQPMFRDLNVTNTITHTLQDTTFIFHVDAMGDGDPQPDLTRNYYWFHQGEIRKTQGTYSGKLLHGSYEKFDRDGYLLMKGSFSHGLKDGSWLSWHTNNNIAKQTSWKDGHRSGTFSEYYPSGILYKTGTFKKDKLHGKLNYYKPDGSILKEEKYVQGKVAIAKEKKVREKKTKSKKDSTQLQKQSLPLQNLPVSDPPVKKQKRKTKNDNAKDSVQSVQAQPQVIEKKKRKEPKKAKISPAQSADPGILVNPAPNLDRAPQTLPDPLPSVQPNIDNQGEQRVEGSDPANIQPNSSPQQHPQVIENKKRKAQKKVEEVPPAQNADPSILLDPARDLERTPQSLSNPPSSTQEPIDKGVEQTIEENDPANLKPPPNSTLDPILNPNPQPPKP